MSEGARVKVRGLEEKGSDISFRNNFMASAIGCKIPTIEILLGPLRIWVRARTFRSIRVKNAMAARARIRDRKEEIKGETIR